MPADDHTCVVITRSPTVFCATQVSLVGAPKGTVPLGFQLHALPSIT